MKFETQNSTAQINYFSIYDWIISYKSTLSISRTFIFLIQIFYITFCASQTGARVRESFSSLIKITRILTLFSRNEFEIQKQLCCCIVIFTIEKKAFASLWLKSKDININSLKKIFHFILFVYALWRERLQHCVHSEKCL